ncbi:hypothetical protein [Ruminococcus albus]|uniref:LPXTG-motif cell wall anchor domain-containing protein n=1 Tax=Ruminococcus albus TaxID=1264 RepID=A0A1H7KUZ8_RUMAL|nr:hypothetical protein [Ruminococcus albus]SEK90306.1 hypothetical protein SAMN05216469_107107 [Ruminococcus albus]
MKKMIIFVVALIVLCMSEITAFARQNADNLSVELHHLTNDAYYIDLLVKMDSSDAYYTDLNQNNMEQFELNAEELKNYSDEDGYISFSCHYKDVYTDIVIDKMKWRDTMISVNCFTMGKDLSLDITEMNEIYEKKRIFKIAVLDERGHIIQVSEPFEALNDKSGYISGEIKYDISDDQLTVDRSSDDKHFVTVYNWYLLIGLIVFLVLSFGFLLHKSSKRRMEKRNSRKIN